MFANIETLFKKNEIFLPDYLIRFIYPNVIPQGGTVKVAVAYGHMGGTHLFRTVEVGNGTRSASPCAALPETYAEKRKTNAA